MNGNVTRLEIRNRILSQTKPFCLVDLDNRINKNNDAEGMQHRLFDEQ